MVRAVCFEKEFVVELKVDFVGDQIETELIEVELAESLADFAELVIEIEFVELIEMAEVMVDSVECQVEIELGVELIGVELIDLTEFELDSESEFELDSESEIALEVEIEIEVEAEAEAGVTEFGVVEREYSADYFLLDFDYFVLEGQYQLQVVDF